MRRASSSVPPGKVRHRECREPRPDTTRCISEASAGSVRSVEQPELGICCSGGGIRSAAFNLGALQSLDEADVLRRRRLPLGRLGRLVHRLGVRGDRPLQHRGGARGPAPVRARIARGGLGPQPLLVPDQQRERHRAPGVGRRRRPAGQPRVLHRPAVDRRPSARLVLRLVAAEPARRGRLHRRPVGRRGVGRRVLRPGRARRASARGPWPPGASPWPGSCWPSACGCSSPGGRCVTRCGGWRRCSWPRAPSSPWSRSSSPSSSCSPATCSAATPTPGRSPRRPAWAPRATRAAPTSASSPPWAGRPPCSRSSCRSAAPSSGGP